MFGEPLLFALFHQVDYGLCKQPGSGNGLLKRIAMGAHLHQKGAAGAHLLIKPRRAQHNGTDECAIAVLDLLLNAHR